MKTDYDLDARARMRRARELLDYLEQQLDYYSRTGDAIGAEYAANQLAVITLNIVSACSALRAVTLKEHL